MSKRQNIRSCIPLSSIVEERRQWRHRFNPNTNTNDIDIHNMNLSHLLNEHTRRRNAIMMEIFNTNVSTTFTADFFDTLRTMDFWMRSLDIIRSYL